MTRRIQHTLLLIFLPLVLRCVDKVELAIPSGELPIIVDGMITDQPGPDTVKLFRGYPADGGYYAPQPIDNAILTITDNTGFVDTMIEVKRGVYVTNLLTGTVGRFYQMSILINDPIKGTTRAVSTQQQLVDAGSIDTIYYEFTSRINTGTGLSENGFNIFINASPNPASSHRMKWKFFGTYTLMTDPASLQLRIPCSAPVCPTMPPACAENCECCTCWYTTSENSPIIATPSILGGSQLTHVFMQYIPINSQTFYERYRVEITQMELSKDVFEFYEAIKRQNENASSIFQPPFSEIEGNISVVNGQEKVMGTFAASTIVKRHIYIPRSAVPYSLASQLLPADCRAVAENATLTMPSYWN